MSPSSIFPPEIYDKIIDEVAPSKDVLSACSLVQRSWVPRSRTHMFHNVDFKVHTSPELDKRSSTKYTAAFQQHVASNSTVASYAHHLVLTLSNGENSASEIPQTSQLLNLRSLTLKCSHSIIYSVNDATLTRLLSFIRRNKKLQTISLQSVVIDPSAFDVFVACIAIRAPGLRSLHLHAIWAHDWVTDAWNRRRAVQGEFSYKSLSLERLCVSNCEEGVIPAFLRAYDLQRLERLALMALDWDSCVKMIATTMNVESLTHITLDLSSCKKFDNSLLHEEALFCRLSTIPTLQLILKQANDSPTVLQKLYCSALHPQPLLGHLHLQFQRLPYSGDTMVDKALWELCSLIPSLRVSVGFDQQESSQIARASTVCSRLKVSSLFPSMNRRGNFQLRPLDEWWSSNFAV
ncbi:hypothetical protein BDP27DRAFT_964573 [Rhodocollybia butyracea]|uniref:Uncharacterized protein n=1 Tax=Rhodocollybia butyracea TaxID=206335 RepID=A0A9P5Q0K4_9AGAR|nr:hypothetical protein BDP27DRAFT_964573 [Rhodocollybia butyracea]